VIGGSVQSRPDVAAAAPNGRSRAGRLRSHHSVPLDRGPSQDERVTADDREEAPVPVLQEGPLTSAVWMHYALTRIRALVDKPRDDMTDEELAIYRLATAALCGGEPIIPLIERGASRLCRVCGAEWPLRTAAAHMVGCPIRTATA
jgi:hypothetical protein